MAAASDACDWAEASGATQLLLRSRSEIAKLLNAAIAGQLPVLARLRNNNGIFVSRLLGLTADWSHVLMAYGDYKAANAQLLAAGNVTLCFNYKNSYIGFPAEQAVDDFSAGAAVIRFAFPAVLFIEQRRSQQRIALIPGVPLRCLADDEGITPFEASIIDIGLGGLGLMVYSEDISLAPGTLLKGCKITLPDLSLVSVDIIIRHAADLVQFEGRRAYRAGCSLVGADAAIQRLIEVFLLDLERRPPLP